MSTSYLLQKSSGHFFRYQFPKDIKALVGKSEIRYSLRTGKLSLAKSRARMIAGKIQGIVRNIRKSSSMAKLTAEQINKIIRQFIKDELEADEHDRIMNDIPFNIDDLKTDIKVQEFNKELFQTALITKSKIYQDDYFKALLDKHGFSDVDTGSLEYKMFCREVTKAHVNISEAVQKRQRGDYKGSDTIVQHETPLPPPVPKVKSKTISEVMELFFAEGDSTNQWTPKTKKEV